MMIQSLPSKTPKVTVVVKSPDATGHLDEFMDALYAQSLKEWECHIIDGTSNLHSQNHCDSKKVFCQAMYEGFEREFTPMANMIARNVQITYGENHPVIIASDRDEWHSSLLEEFLEDYENAREEKND